MSEEKRYYISDGNAVFDNVPASRARELVAGWFADCFWDPEFPLGKLESAGFDFRVDYTENEDPEDIAIRVTEHVATALADLRVQNGELWWNAYRDELSSCRLTVREDESEGDEEENL